MGCKLEIRGFKCFYLNIIDYILFILQTKLQSLKDAEEAARLAAAQEKKKGFGSTFRLHFGGHHDKHKKGRNRCVVNAD